MHYAITICYGTFDATDQEIEDIIHATHLDILIKQLPQGLNTAVGERGLKLSGGERQRIALARALLKRPAILIFDEATASLGVKTEEAIQKNIAVASKNTTTLVIAHRLSTIVEADTILVLSYGLIWSFAQIMEVVREMSILSPQVAATNNFSMNLFRHLHLLSIRYHMDRKTGSIVSAYKQIGWAYPEIVRLLLCVIVPLLIEVALAIIILSYFLFKSSIK